RSRAGQERAVVDQGHPTRSKMVRVEYVSRGLARSGPSSAVLRCRTKTLRPPSSHLLVITAYPAGGDHYSLGVEFKRADCFSIGRNTTFCIISRQDRAVYTGDLVAGEDQFVNLMTKMEGEETFICRTPCRINEWIGNASSRTPRHVEAGYRVTVST